MRKTPKKEGRAFRNICKNIHIHVFPTVKSALLLLFYIVLLPENLLIKGPVIIYRLGRGDFSGDHLIFRRTKGGIRRN